MTNQTTRKWLNLIVIGYLLSFINLTVIIILFSSSTFFLENRKTIKILFPREAAERQHTQEFSEDYFSLLSKFEALSTKQRRHSSTNEAAQFVQHQHVGFSLSKIVFIVVSLLGIAMVSSFSVLPSISLVQ